MAGHDSTLMTESVGGSNTLYHTKLFLMDTHVAIR